jgi:hypothetical protein
MLGNAAPRPHHPASGNPEEFEPGALPVEPDQGAVPSGIPEDPEHGRMVDPEA